MSEEDKKPETFDELKYQVRSEEIEDILSYVPNWLIRWGISIFIAILTLLIVGSAILRYPDVINALVTISTKNPPVRLIAKSDGLLDSVFVLNNQMVKKGDYIAVIKNPAITKDVIELKRLLEEYESIDENFKAISDSTMRLGELQIPYSTFKEELQKYEYFLKNNFYAQKIQSFKRQIAFYSDLNENLERQKLIADEELKNAEELYAKYEMLFEKNMIGKDEFLQYQSQYLQKKYNVENLGANIIRNNIQLEEYQKTVLEIAQQYGENKQNYIIRLNESFKTLRAQYDSWKERYVIAATETGKVSFFNFWSKNQQVTPGTVVAAIIPDTTELIARAVLPGAGVGKVEIGQKVRIKLNAYPYEQFGVIIGNISAVSAISSENNYVVSIDLEQGLTTTYHKQLDLSSELQGTAEIITKDISLLERFFYNFRALFDK